MKVDWHKIPETGLPEGCPVSCFIGRPANKHVWHDDNCMLGMYGGEHYLDLFYADATGHIPDPPEPEPENPPKPARDHENMLAALNTIRAVVDNSIRELT